MLSGGMPIEMIAQRMFNAGLSAANHTMVSLATGLRINRGADDPAGVISSQALLGALASLDAETRSLQRADAVASAADGALSEVSDLLTEAEGLAVAAANTGATTPEERAAMQMEMNSILQAVDRMAGSSFAGRRLFDGNMSLNVGQDTITVSAFSSSSLGLSDVAAGGSMNLESGDAEGAADAIRAARATISTARAEIGSFQKDAIEPRVRAMSIASENTAAAVSMIRDTDYASAMSDLTRQRVMFGAAGRMLRLAGEQNATVLGLLGPR